MSTSPKADGTTVQRHEELADHVGEEFAAVIAAFRATMAGGSGLDYLAHYSSGVFDYSVDLLGDPPRHEEALPGSTHRDELQRLGRSLSFAVSTLDRTLQEARTGGLIRTVLHTERGAAFCCSVVPKQDLVGIVLDTAAPAGGSGNSGNDVDDGYLSHAAVVSSADRAVSALATRLREQVRLPSANPGGWASVVPVGALPEDGPSVAPFTCEMTEQSGASDALMAACRDAVRPTDLQLVAYCLPGEVVFTADCLDDRSLAPFFTQIAVGARRRFYQRLSEDLCALAARFSRATSTALGGLLLRMVLDVEQGAIYYYRLKAGDYLVGVTVDQSRVSAADDRMSSLANRAREILAG